MTGVLTKRGNLDLDTGRRRPRELKAEIGVMSLQAKERQRWPAKPQERGVSWVLPLAQKEIHLDLDSWPPDLRESVSAVQDTWFVVLCSATLED